VVASADKSNGVFNCHAMARIFRSLHSNNIDNFVGMGWRATSNRADLRRGGSFMKTDRVSNIYLAEREDERSPGGEDAPWSRLLRAGAPQGARSHGQCMTIDSYWPGAQDAQWSARLQASLHNLGRTRLKYRV
jgi:hypothetical protein